MKSFVTSVLVVSVLTMSVARADPGSGDDAKSETAATQLSLFSTLAGGALMIAAFESDPIESSLHSASVPFGVTGATLLLLGPSFGHWYAHQGWTSGMTVRLAGSALFGLGLFGYLLDRAGSHGDTSLSPLMIGGAAVFAGGAVLDIGRAGAAVRAYNREHAGVQLTLAPIVVRSGGDAHAGLGVVGRF